jgi:hypothetical protein
MEISFEIPLDGDGYRRHECPTCERELKWPGEAALGDLAGGPFCPYCGIQAPEDSWWTRPQLEHIEYLSLTRIVQPGLSGLRSRFLKVELERVAEPPPLVEDDSMRMVVPACHPDLPVKVAEGWLGVVHCSICGTSAESSR